MNKRNLKSVDAEVFDLVDMVPDLPAKLKDEVERDPQIATIVSNLNEGIKYIFVDGGEGVGKTTLLSQFVKQNPNSCISLFLGSGSSYALEISSIRWSLYNQLKWLVKGEAADIEYDPDDAEIKHLVAFLHRKALTKKNQYYFVVDGLYEVEDERRKTVEEYIYDIIPIGAVNIGVVFSGRVVPKGDFIDKRIERRQVNCPVFGKRETRDFFGGLVKEENLDSIRKVCGGNPGFLSSVKRLIENGVDFGDGLEGLPDKLPELFNFEWERMKEIGGDAEKIISIITFSLNALSARGVSSITGIHEGVVIDAVNDISFLEIDEVTNEIKFVNPGYQKFSAKKMAKNKDWVVESIIEDMMSRPEDDDSLHFLPKYYSRYGRNEDLLSVLDGSRLVKILIKNKNVSSVMEYVNYGIDASKLGKSGYRLQLAKSCISSLTASVSSKSEVEAALALGDKEKAFYIADSVKLDEDRLYLLSSIAAGAGDWNYEDRKLLSDSIDVVALRVNPSVIGEERCSEIAQDIFNVSPETAINLIEKSISENDEKSKDWALARLSFSANSKNDQSEAERDSLNKIKSKISSSRYREIFSAANSMASTDSIESMKALLGKLDRTSDKLIFIRQWCKLNKKTKGAEAVTREAIDIAIADANFVPSASFYNDISLTLPFAQDEKCVNEIIRLIDGQSGLIKEKGPTLDYVALQISISQAEYITSDSDFIDRVSDLYLGYISDIEDAVVKAGALGKLLDFLARIDSDKNLEDSEGLHSSVEADFDDCVEDIFKCSADQAETLCLSVETIAEKFPEKAIFISGNLNSVGRRDLSYSAMIEALLDSEYKNIDWVVVRKALVKISDVNIKDEAVHSICERIALIRSCSNFDFVETFFNDAFSIVRPSLRARSLICLLLFFKSNNYSGDSRSTSVLLKVYKAWDAIDTPWIKIDTGFKICADLAEIDIEKAKEYSEASENLKNEVGAAESEETSYAEFYSTRLAIRSYYALLLAGKSSDSDFKKIEQVITCTECQSMRAAHWALVSLAYHMANRNKECAALYFKYVQPVVDTLKTTNKSASSRIFLLSSPAAWVSYKDSAINEIRALEWPYSDQAFYRIAIFLLEKVWPDDPYVPSPNDSYDIEYTDALDIVEVAGYIKDDAASSQVIRKLIGSLASPVSRSRITGEQKNLLISKIDILIDEKYPSDGFIPHDGYKIYLKSYLSKLSKLSWPEWSALIEKAKLIQNVSDRVFVLGSIVENIPSKHSSHRFELLEKVKGMMSEIRSAGDKMSRYHYLAEIFWPIDSVVARGFIKEGLLKTSGEDSFSARRKQLDLVDLAHKVDPDLPEKIIDSSDKDPARARLRSDIKKQTDNISFRKSLSSPSADIKELIKNNKDELPRAAWKNLSLLHADKARPLTETQCRVMSIEASRFPIDQAYPIYAWMIESLRKGYASTPSGEDFIRPVFESCCENVLFLESMVAAACGVRPFVPNEFSQDGFCGGAAIIRKGDRSLAMEMMADWLLENSPEELVFSDPYFCPESFELLRLISDNCNEVRVSVLTSLKAQQDKGYLNNIEDGYRAAWVRKYGEISPPQTDIAVLGLEGSGGSPVHDRWLVCNNGGIRLGTSFNSIGGNKDSEVSFFNEEEALGIKNLLEGYLYRKTRVKDGKKINISFFEL